ncbi:hypothetical protein CF319_g2166 [Tilletia indica]|uniref:Tetratricopeptide SHNi-TPR domain-containing protein n=1 Tax=Tilletia indica TaxID=43049 RepID=A0A177TVA2_9BASI|nr:hypothetical protein CF319_g2166 [Tilletia indica]KAE8258465.1 hypothetical protein A4X13_0g1673 [Tilletia indica]
MSSEPQTAREFYDQGIRLAALKKHADAAEAFSQCLELLRDELNPQDENEDAKEEGGEESKQGEEEEDADTAQVEDDPKLAPVLHKYGRELLNHAIASAFTVAGRGGAGKAALPSKVALPEEVPAAGGSSNKDSNGTAAAGSSSSTAAPQGKLISFSGDDEAYDREDEEEEEGEGDEEGEDDDMETAFAALDVSRRLYERVLSSSSAPTLETFDGSTLTHPELVQQLANVLTDLGELHLESETFIQAVLDFQSALDVLKPIVDPRSFSRRLAEAHFQLGLALEYHPEDGKRAEALEHVSATRKLVIQRRGALVERRNASAAEVEKELQSQKAQEEVINGNGKGKGKGKAVEPAVRLAEDDVRGLSKEQATREIGEVDELLKDLDSKIEELQGSLENGGAVSSADKAVRQAIDEAFHGGSSAVETINPFTGKASSASAATPANDLTTLVKKKKKQPVAVAAAEEGATTVAAGKRKAESDGAVAALDSESNAKKARVENALPGEE